MTTTTTATTPASDPFASQQAHASARAGHGGLRGVLLAMRPALQWRLMLLWLLALLLPALAAALPVWSMLGAAFDRSVHAPALARHLDLVAIADLMSLYRQHASALAGGGTVALVMTLLLSPLLTGAAITAARAPAVLGFAALAAGGVREYGRLLRMLLWAVVPLGLAGLLGVIGLGAAEEHTAGAVLESTVADAALGASMLAGLLLLLAHASLDAGRAMLALEPAARRPCWRGAMAWACWRAVRSRHSGCMPASAPSG